MCALSTEPACYGTPVVGVSTPFLPSLKQSPSLMVTAVRLGLQVKDQGSASAVEEPSVWLFPHKEGGAGQLFPAPPQSLIPAESFSKGCGMLSVLTSQTAWLGREGPPTGQDAILSSTFGQKLYIPCVKEEIPLLPHFTDEET